MCLKSGSAHSLGHPPWAGADVLLYRSLHTRQTIYPLLAFSFIFAYIYALDYSLASQHGGECWLSTTFFDGKHFPRHHVMALNLSQMTAFFLIDLTLCSLALQYSIATTIFVPSHLPQLCSPRTSSLILFDATILDVINSASDCRRRRDWPYRSNLNTAMPLSTVLVSSPCRYNMPGISKCHLGHSEKLRLRLRWPWEDTMDNWTTGDLTQSYGQPYYFGGLIGGLWGIDRGLHFLVLNCSRIPGQLWWKVDSVLSLAYYKGSK